MNWIEPVEFQSGGRAQGAELYLRDPLVGKLLAYFEQKGLAKLKEEDRKEEWDGDWLAYQARHGIYAGLLCPRRYSSKGSELNLSRLTRFLEVFASLSPSHGYSLQVTFLGLFAILAGKSEKIKREAVGLLERGSVLGFGISEKEHGADLLATEFTIAGSGAGGYAISGSKYYIGNANVAAMIAVLAREEQKGKKARRAPLALLAFRPREGAAYSRLEKIRTFGVRSAFVGDFTVREQEVPEGDVIAQGREAWDAVFGAVTLGKFFLGFGSIGMCERAMGEAVSHLTKRVLFGKPAIAMGHLRTAMSQAYARLLGMKLYAYRALDYVNAATAEDRRYLLFTAVQKAKVSTQGVVVMRQMMDCVGAFGFESRTFFEMALRDSQLIPGLEGSRHINLGVAAQCIDGYFSAGAKGVEPAPVSPEQGENEYLFAASAGGMRNVKFAPHLRAYRPWMAVPNVRVFVGQIKALRLCLRGAERRKTLLADGETALWFGELLATVAYGQLIAESARLRDLSREMLSAVFHLLIEDLSCAALGVAGLARFGEKEKKLLLRMVAVPLTTGSEWDMVAEKMMGMGSAAGNDAGGTPA